MSLIKITGYIEARKIRHEMEIIYKGVKIEKLEL